MPHEHHPRGLQLGHPRWFEIRAVPRLPRSRCRLDAWHQAQVASHVAHLREIADRVERPRRLRSVLEADASLAPGRQGDQHAPQELALFCIHAVGAATDLPSNAAARQLVSVVLTALRPD